MGGKPKQSQRTKNNVKPSSSGRSAELLNSGKVDAGLVCVGGGKILPALFPTLAAATVDNDLDPEFQMCIKKLNKKDPVTKTKALQELTELVNNSKVDDVVAALPSWAHYYKILSIDVDRKVREYTQACHGAVVTVCGRRVAPALRQLVPAWLLAQHDAHAPAHTLARNSLASTFPDNKLPDVISFCKTEIFAYIIENLTSNPDTILTKKIENAEDKETQYNSIVTSSLQCLSYMTLRLPAEHEAWLWDTFANKLMQQNAFWKLASFNCNQIRAAWYEAMGRIIERFGSKFGEKFGLKTTRVLMGVAKEQNALVAASLWSCLVMLMHNIPEWHSYLDKKELIVKRILDVLENGGWGDTRHLTSVLLPLLASLPEHLLTKEFYENFFSAMFTGLEKKNILASKSERQLWITNLAECLRYLSVQQNDFIVEVTTSVHRSWLQNILSKEHTGQLKTNLVKHSATKMASLVKYWLKQSQVQNSEKYDQLIRNFWQNIGSIFLTQIDKLSTDEEDIASVIEGHVLLLQTMKISFLQESKKQQSIKFDTDLQIPNEEEISSPDKCDPNLSDRYLHNLGTVVHNVCAHYLNFANEMKTAKAVLTPLLTLLIEFDDKELFLALARQFNMDSLIKFYESILSVWICDEAMRCKAVVDIVFLMLRHMSEDEQNVVMNSFEKLPASAMEWCLELSVSHPHRLRGAVREWLRSQTAEDTLLRVCERDMRRAPQELRNLLLMCFSHHDQEELLISERAVGGVVAAACAALRVGAGGAGGAGGVEGEGCVEGRCRVVCALGAALLGRAPSAAASLLLALVNLTLQVPRGDERLSVDTWCELRSSAQDGVAALPRDNRRLLLKQIAHLMREPYWANTTNAELDMNKIENLCTLCPYLITANSYLPEDLSEMIMFTEALFEVASGYSYAHHFALRYDCVHSKLNCLFDDDVSVQRVIQECGQDDKQELTKSDLVWFLARLLLRAMYLRTMFLHKPDDDDDEQTASWCERLLSEQYFQTEFCKVLYDYMVICTLHEGYGFWAHHSIIEEGKLKLDLLLDEMIKETPQVLRMRILGQLSESAARTGLYWSYARRYYQSITQADVAHSFDDLLQEHSQDMQLAQLQEIITGNGFFHTLQANIASSEEARDILRAKYLVMVRGVVRMVSTALPPALQPRFTRDLLAHCAVCHLDLVVNAYYMHHHIMLFDTDITNSPWYKAVSNAAILEYLTELVSRDAWNLPPHHWDFINIACCSIITSIDKSKQAWGTAKVSVVARSVLRLFVEIQQFVDSVPEQCERSEPAPHIAHLPAEWNEIFLPTIHDNLYHTIMYVLECEHGAPTASHIAVLHGLAASTRRLEWSWLPKALQVDTFALSRVCARAAHCLARAHHVAAKFLAHDFLAMHVDPLILEDMAKLSMWSDQTASDGREEYDRPKLALEYFDEQIDYLQDIVNAVVANVELGCGVVEVTPFTDSHSSCVGWLLLLRFTHKLFNRARSTVALHYLEIYRDNNFAEPVLNAALRLLPERLFHFAHDSTAGTQLPPHYTDMFFHNTPLDMYEPVRAELVCALACGAVCAGVSCAAAGARAWAAAAPVSRARALRRLVRACITPTLVRDHFTAVTKAAPNFTNAVVTIYWSTYEVVCVYTVEDRPMELHITLAKDYPIGVATVQAPSVITPCADTNWVALYLAHQNGSVVEAVRMWMQGVEARVENSPVCYICYARLHAATGRLPRMCCHQCRNKFHVACLNKWFHTSVKSSCPLCRAIF